MKRKLLALLLMGASMTTLADPTSIVSWPGPSTLTNYEIKQSTDILSTPPGWAAPASGQTQPTPPYRMNPSVYLGWYSGYDGTSNNPTPTAACIKFPGVTWAQAYQVTNHPYVYQCMFSNGTTNDALVSEAFGCLPGYSQSTTNGSCIVTTTTANVPKPSDGICTLIRNADGTWAYDNGGGVNAGDPDCTPAWQDAIAAVNDKTRGDACSCDKTSPTPEISE